MDLRVERLISTRNRPGMVLALAGGPGQSITSLGSAVAFVLAPLLPSRQLVIFDQRGTGNSGALDCPALQRATGVLTDARQLSLSAGCGSILGAPRAFYTTTESVADMEAVRQALGVDRAAVMGVSYGTYVAQRYAEAHPDHTELLLLDSVVPLDGGDPFELRPIAAVPSVLDDLCAAGACDGITGDPVADVSRLVDRLHGGAVAGRVYDARGRARRQTIRSTELFTGLVAGDLNPLLRVAYPAAVRSALAGDMAPLARLVSLGSEPAGKLSEESVGLFFATSCEESPLPWRPDDPLAGRPASLDAALAAVPPARFRPFDAAAGREAQVAVPCQAWPVTSVAPIPARSPIVAPTLILSGRDDVRTPFSDARRTADAIAGSQLLEVAGTGHSVMTSDITGCVHRALQRFANGAPVGDPCAGRTNAIFDPLPELPRSLSQLNQVLGVSGRAGRTLAAVLFSLDDTAVAAITIELNGAPEPVRGGGLRGGYFRYSEDGSDDTQTLHGVASVAGVRVTGRVHRRNGIPVGGNVRVSGPAAARGTVRFAGARITGRLGRTRIDTTVPASLAAARWSRWRAAVAYARAHPRLP